MSTPDTRLAELGAQAVAAMAGLTAAVRELREEIIASRKADEPGLIELTHGPRSSDQSDDEQVPLPSTPEDGLDRNGNAIEHSGITRLAQAIEDVTGSDYGTAEWLAGSVYRTLTQMRRRSLGRPAELDDDPGEDSPDAWAILYDREGAEPAGPDDADYEISPPGAIRGERDPGA
jgi:hypothetical protein